MEKQIRRMLGVSGFVLLIATWPFSLLGDAGSDQAAVAADSAAPTPKQKAKKKHKHKKKNKAAPVATDQNSTSDTNSSASATTPPPALTGKMLLAKLKKQKNTKNFYMLAHIVGLNYPLGNYAKAQSAGDVKKKLARRYLQDWPIGQEVTVFVPIDYFLVRLRRDLKAIGKALQSPGEKGDALAQFAQEKKRIKGVLEDHIVKGSYAFDALPDTLQTLSGKTISPRDFNYVTKDIKAGNGVMHIISNLAIDEFDANTDVDQKKNLSDGVANLRAALEVQSKDEAARAAAKEAAQAKVEARAERKAEKAKEKQAKAAAAEIQSADDSSQSDSNDGANDGASDSADDASADDTSGDDGTDDGAGDSGN